MVLEIREGLGEGLGEGYVDIRGLPYCGLSSEGIDGFFGYAGVGFNEGMTNVSLHSFAETGRGCISRWVGMESFDIRVASFVCGWVGSLPLLEIAARIAGVMRERGKYA